MGIKLSKAGMEYMETQRKMKGWNKYDPKWQKEANVSEMTLKRFWKGDSISPDCFKNICKAVDVDLKNFWDLLVESDKRDSTRVPSLAEVKEIYTLPPEASETKFRITVRGVGILDEDEQLLVQANLDDLGIFLNPSRVSFLKVEEAITELELSKAKFTINVNGVGFFNENEKLLVKAILEELKGFLSRSYVIRIQPVCEMESASNNPLA